MSMKNSPSSVTNGLVFHYDMNNPKSWKGKPTTNYAYDQNPRIDTTYASRIYTSANTYPVHHPDGITVYNPNGGNISDYVNTGVTDWTNTYHAIWTYDRALRKPVVTMRDVDAAWKAKSFGLSIGGTPAAMGLGYGDLYTISWLQWTDNISKSVNAGMYGANTSGVNNFHDGLSQSAYDSTYAFNTKPYTWQRVWATFQVNAVRNLSAGWACYMYGYFNTRNTVKIADVQIETGYVSPIVENNASTRSNTRALLDLTGQKTITVQSLTYSSNGSFTFNGSSDYLTIPSTNLGNGNLPWTVSAWVKTTTTASTLGTGSVLSNQASGPVYSVMCVNSGKIAYWTYQNAAWAQKLGVGTTVNDGNWHMLTWVNYNNNTMDMYVDGKLDSNVPNSTSGNQNPVDIIGGSWNSKFAGNIDALSIYNVSLSAEQIAQNFNALRGRYGI